MRDGYQGIGLYVVKLIAERYGGFVEAHNRPDGNGVTFRVALPRIPQSSDVSACGLAQR